MREDLAGQKIDVISPTGKPPADATTQKSADAAAVDFRHEALPWFDHFRSVDDLVAAYYITVRSNSGQASCFPMGGQT